MKTVTCRGPNCGKPIVFVNFRGRKHPVNPEPKKMLVAAQGDEYELRDCYESHYATCADAKAFRGNHHDRG